MKKYENSYKKSGVNISLANKLVKHISKVSKKNVKKTVSNSFKDEIGGFGSLFDISNCKIKDPVIVSCTDGVGTKIELAAKYKKFDTIVDMLTAEPRKWKVRLTTNGYKIDEWWNEVLKYIDDVELVLPAAGMAGRVINKRLWDLNKDIHSIELGSVYDAVSGLHTRSWMNGENYDTLQKILL